MAVVENYKDKLLQAYSPRVTPLTIVFPAPDTPTGLTLSQVVKQSESGEISVVLTAEWTASVDTHSGYTVAYKNTTDGDTVFSTFDTNELQAIIPVTISGKSVTVKVKANYVDASSAYTADVIIVTLGDVVATSPSTTLTVTSGITVVTIDWDRPPELDYSHTEIWASLTTNDRTLANLAAEISGSSWSTQELPAGIAGYVWVRHLDTSENESTWFPVSSTAGVFGSSELVSTADLDTALTADVQNGIDAFDGTVDYRTAGSPSNDIVPIDIIIKEQDNASRDINLLWDVYVQGALPALDILLFYYEALPLDIQLLLTFDTDYTDTGINALTTTVTGAVAIDSTRHKFGGGSALFNQSALNYIDVTASADLYMPAATDVTIEFWIYMTSGPTGGETYMYIVDSRPEDASGGKFFYTSSGVLSYSKNSGTLSSPLDFGSPALNTWHHIRICVESSFLHMYLNGELVNYQLAYTETVGSTSAWRIGNRKAAFIYAGNNMNGNIEQLVVIKGESITKQTDDYLLLNFRDILNPEFGNEGIYHSDLQFVTGAAISTAQSKFSGSSLKITGSSSNYVNINRDTSALPVDATIEFFIYLTVLPTGNPTLLDMLGTVVPPNNRAIRLDSTGDMTYEDMNVPVTISFGVISLNTWTHVRLCKSGTTLYTFKDGTLQNTATHSVDLTQNGAWILGNNGSNAAEYYIDAFRVRDTEALSTASFTVPTAERTGTFFNVPTAPEVPYDFRDVVATDSSIVLPITATSYNFIGMNPDSGYRFGIAAARYTEAGGYEMTNIIQPMIPQVPDWSVEPGEIRIGSSTVDTLLSDVDGLIADFDATNNTDYTALVVPTVASDGSAISHDVNPSSSVNISFTWAWAGDESEIDGFAITGRVNATDTAAYTFGTNLDEEWAVQLPASHRNVLFTNLPATSYYSVAVVAYRRVNKDATLAPEGLLATGYIQSGHTSEKPYQPETTDDFTGDNVGTTAVTDIDTVIAGVLNDEYVTAEASNIVSMGEIDGTGTSTVAQTLTTKPGASTATNTWVSVVVAGKKYWIPAFEDVT